MTRHDTQQMDPMIVVPASTLAQIDGLKAEVSRLVEIIRPMAEAAQWKTVHEMAEEMGVSLSTINRQVADGRLIARGSGPTRRVRLPVPDR